MNGVTTRFDDRLDLLSVVVGVFLVLVGVGTITGMPWQTNLNAFVSVFQLLGIAGTIVIGVGLAWLGRQT